MKVKTLTEELKEFVANENKEEKTMAKNNMNITFVNTEANSWSSDAGLLEKLAFFPTPTKRDIPDDIRVEDAKVNENKEEKKMTKDKHVMKNAKGQIEEVKEEVTTAVAAGGFDFFNNKRKELEEQNEGVDYSMGAKSNGSLAQRQYLGRHDIPITDIQLVTAKREANEDEDTPAAFYLVLVVHHKAPFKPIKITLTYKLFQDDVMMETPVFNAIVDPNRVGTSIYYTPKKKSLDKKVEDFVFEKDLEMHVLASNQNIWAPGDKEIRALRKLFDLEDFSFDNEGKVVGIPECTIPVYVYEDYKTKEIMTMVKEKDKKTGKEVEKAKKTTVDDSRFKVSFMPPEEHVDRNGKEKYGKRFTTTTAVDHVKMISELPGVQAYWKAVANK